MFLAKITKKITSSHKHDAYKGKSVFLVRTINPDGTDAGEEWVAMDYIGAGVGDTVICGGAPGVAKNLFNLKLAPIRTLLMAVVEKIDYRDVE